MQKLLIGLTLFTSMSSFGIDWSSVKEDMKKDSAEAYFATELVYCNSEEALQELLETMSIKSELGCKKAIKDAQMILGATKTLSILTAHVRDLKDIQNFEALVKTDVGYVELVPEVLRLKEKGINLNRVKRSTQLTDEQTLKVELSFERSKTDLERAIESL